jgi:hypothetical protein
MRNISANDLRRTFCELAQAGGVNSMVAAKMTGHMTSHTVEQVYDPMTSAAITMLPAPPPRYGTVPSPSWVRSSAGEMRRPRRGRGIATGRVNR